MECDFFHSRKTKKTSIQNRMRVIYIANKIAMFTRIRFLGPRKRVAFRLIWRVS